MFRYVYTSPYVGQCGYSLIRIWIGITYPCKRGYVRSCGSSVRTDTYVYLRFDGLCDMGGCRCDIRTGV